MFALHYFFGSENSVSLLLSTVAANLKRGGYFFGIVPDGKRINEYLLFCGHDESFRVTAQWTGPPRAFGSAYSFEIADTVTEGGGLLEFLVYENVLCKMAKTVGLEPVYEVPIDGISQTAPRGLFKHLTPPSFGGAWNASRLYAAFVFKKM
jgi:hypothetical protein